jgi:hypothetical protein
MRDLWFRYLFLPRKRRRLQRYIPRVLELSYINRSLVQSYEISYDQMHPTSLDMPNDPGHPDSEFAIRD